MSIGNLFGTGSESNSLYGTSLTSNGSSSFIYFEWFIFKESTGQPTTPTGGSWDFLSNTGVPPTGWSSTVNGIPANNLWFSVAFVDSRNPTNIVWSTTGLISAATSVYATAYADTFTGTGSTTVWTLTADPVVVNNLDVSINGVTQTPTVDYTISGTTFTTTTAAPLGSIILVKYRQALPNSYFGTANNVGYTPFSWIAATNVQAALNEVATDISATDGVSGSNLVGYKASGTGAVATTVQAKLRQYVNVKDFGAIGNGTTNDATAIQAAINSLTSGGTVFFPTGTYLVASQIVVADKVNLEGTGYATESGTGAANRGSSCILRGFTGSDATVALNGAGSGMDMLDVDGNLQGTGDGVQVWGTRVHIGTISTRNNGGDGLRIGKTEAGPSTVNCNFWKVDYLITCGNSKNGFRIDQTNTSTSLSYPLGASDCNAGYCGLIDARSNAEDGLQLGNCNDNVFANVGAQFSGGIGIHFKTDGTNSGPRCNTILSNDSEANTGNDIQIDAATLPVSGPGLYNKIWGNRSVAVNSRIVDNSTGSSIYTWNNNAGCYVWNGRVVAYEPSDAKSSVFDFYQGSGGNNVVGMRGITEGTSGGLWELYTKRDGDTIAKALSVNSKGILVQYRNYNPQIVQPNVPVDVAAGTLVNLNVTSTSAFQINSPTNDGASGQQLTICVKNTSGGSIGPITWGAEYKLAAWTNPANGFSRSISFFYDGTNWIEYSRTSVDIPN